MSERDVALTSKLYISTVRTAIWHGRIGDYKYMNPAAPVIIML